MTRSKFDVALELAITVAFALVVLAAGYGWVLVALAAAGPLGAVAMGALYVAVACWIVGRGR